MDVREIELLTARALRILSRADAVLDAARGGAAGQDLNQMASELGWFCLRDLPLKTALTDVELFRLHLEIEKRLDALHRFRAAG